jgi:hypothetical protein
MKPDSYSNIPLILHILARRKLRQLDTRSAVIDRLGMRRPLLSKALVMDGHADNKGARTDKEKNGGPRRD